MAKAEISWSSTDEAGTKFDHYVHHFGKKWIFYKRQRRYDQWQEVAEPPLEDWMELLDGLRRRAQRRLVRPEAVDIVIKMIRERFPEATLD